MKKYLVFTFLLIVAKSHSQFEFAKENYYNCLESSYQLNYGITLSSPIKGNYEKANALLNTAYFNGNPDKALLIKALLAYNTQGEKTAFNILDASSASDEEKEFSKLWLSFYAKNTEEYTTRLNDFEERYPKNHNTLKLKYRAILDYRDANMLNSVYDEKQNALTIIDSLTKIPTLQKDDKLFFSLLKLDFLAHEERDRKKGRKDVSYSEEETIAHLISIWKENKEAFNSEYFLKRIGDCPTADCKEAQVYTFNKTNKFEALTSAEKVYNLFLSMELRQTLPKMESMIDDIVSKEKNEEQLSSIKGIISLFTLSKVPQLGFFSEGTLKPILFSKEFKSRYAAPQDKAIILKKIKKMYDSPELEGFTAAPGMKELFLKEFETAKSLSAPDVQAIYGVLIFSYYYAKSIVGAMPGLGKFNDGPNAVQREDYKKYIDFLDKNPLYFDKSMFLLYAATFHSEQEVMAFIKESEKLREKYPAAWPLIENCMHSVASANALITKNEAQNYYLGCLKLVIDACKVNSSRGKADELENEFYYFGIIQNHQHMYSSKAFTKEFIALLSDDTKKQAEDYLRKSIAEYPNQKSLKDLRRKLIMSIAPEKYLDNYLNNIAFEYNQEKMESLQLISLDSVYISKRLKKAIKDFKEKNNYSALQKTIPLLYLNSENDNAIDLLIYVLKNNSNASNFNDTFSQTCMPELYEALGEEECIEKMSKIQKEVPKFELNYLYTIALKLENEDLRKEALQMLQNYNRQNFYPSGSDLSKYTNLKKYLTESYFDQENISLIFKEIGKKYPAVLKL